MKSLVIFLSFTFSLLACTSKPSSGVSNLNSAHTTIDTTPSPVRFPDYMDSIIWLAYGPSDGIFKVFRNETATLEWQDSLSGKQEKRYFSISLTIKQEGRYWSLLGIDTRGDSIFCGVTNTCNEVRSPFNCTLRYKGKDWKGFEGRFYLPTLFHDIYVLKKYNDSQLDQWGEKSNQVTLEVNLTDKRLMITGSCQSATIPFEIVAQDNICLGKAKMLGNYCTLVNNGLELIVTVQQRRFALDRSGRTIRMIAPGDTLEFYKVD